MKRSSKKRNLAVFPVIAITSFSLLAGCELLVDFDRTLIDAGSLDQVDATFDGSEPFDSATDSPSTSDASDATVDDSSTPDDAGDAAIDDASDADIDADM